MVAVHHCAALTARLKCSFGPFSPVAIFTPEAEMLKPSEVERNVHCLWLMLNISHR